MDSDELANYRRALQEEWEQANPATNLVAAAQKARADLLGLLPDSIVALKAILASGTNEKLRSEVAKFIISYTIGDKAKVAMPAGITNPGADELQLLYADLGAEKDDIPNRPE